MRDDRAAGDHVGIDTHIHMVVLCAVRRMGASFGRFPYGSAVITQRGQGPVIPQTDLVPTATV